ncbi:MAG: hypothetical protein H6737_14850 [Alphaproteobacteria bacterium]|nr:hypothetical protein [Alphaproteobacteria bacterium]
MTHAVTTEEIRSLRISPPDPLSDAELRRLRDFDIAVFEGRIVTEARPPIGDAAVAAIAAQLLGPIPDGLLALWRTCFGGRLLYDLHATFEGVGVPFSFSELFYPGSDHYRTLDGWMEHELELAQEVAEERGEPPPERLVYLPFGGFEYLERVYVRVTGEPGSVWGWRQSLPAAWSDPVGHDAVCRLADDVPALFRALYVDEDDAVRGGGTANDLLEWGLEPLRDAGEEALAQRVRAHYLAAARVSPRGRAGGGSSR